MSYHIRGFTPTLNRDSVVNVYGIGTFKEDVALAGGIIGRTLANPNDNTQLLSADVPDKDGEEVIIYSSANRSQNTAQKVEIVGLDSNYKEKISVITAPGHLNDAVVSIGTYSRINSMKWIENAPAIITENYFIHAMNKAKTKLFKTMIANCTHSEDAIYTVPEGYKFYIDNVYGSINSSTADAYYVDIDVYYQVPGSHRSRVFSFGINNNMPYFHYKQDVPSQLEGPLDIYGILSPRSLPLLNSLEAKVNICLRLE